jgi:hypothetical protein
VLGHEAAGRVVKVGSAVKNLKEGKNYASMWEGNTQLIQWGSVWLLMQFISLKKHWSDNATLGYLCQLLICVG